MPRKPIACPSCGALVSGGRLSCPSCGTLVATVTGAPRLPTSAKPAAPAAPSPAPAASAPRGRSTPRLGPQREQPVAPIQAAPPAAGLIASEPARPVPGVVTPAVLTPQASQEPPSWALRPTARTGSILHDLETRPANGWLSSRAEDYDSPDAPEAPPAIPGAYLAPSAAFTAPVPRAGHGIRGARPFEAPAGLRPGQPAYLTSATGAVSAVAFAPQPNAPVRVAAESEPKARSGISVQAPAELPGWLTIAGSAIAAVSFLMPWSRDGVIGAVGSAYFDRWGLANAGYLPLVLVALGLLVVNGVPNPIPSWIRAGVAPLAIGGILFGLDWAYQTRPFSDGLGVTLLLVGAIVLVAGGLVGVRAGRHLAAPPAV